MTKISAVTVCINYDDFLCHTIENYITAFDEVLVVTEAEDTKTIRLCQEFGVPHLESKSKNYKDEPFNLPALINDGFAALKEPEWLCKIDPDIFIPKPCVEQLRQSLGSIEQLWGADRYFCESIDHLEAFISTNNFDHLEPPYEEGDDVLGFLQLFHASSTYLGNIERPYEEEYYIGPSHTNDRIMCRQWPLEQRNKLPFSVIHLGLEAVGTNWKGRKSNRFD